MPLPNNSLMWTRLAGGKAVVDCLPGWARMKEASQSRRAVQLETASPLAVYREELPWRRNRKVVNIGGQYVNLGVAGVSYFKKPDYVPDWELCANVTYVFS